jgi:GntR family transcriptional repressor for pyruvate dehydrogenase complex
MTDLNRIASARAAPSVGAAANAVDQASSRGDVNEPLTSNSENHEVGVSRPVMREAFGALAALQIIDVGVGRKPRVGAIDGTVFATSLTHAVNTAQISIVEIWDVRRTVEIRTAELAAESRTEPEAEKILSLSDAIAANCDDAEFHQTVARASHNTLFAQILISFDPMMRVAIREAWKTCTTKALKQAMVRRHRTVAKAIAKRDPAAAAAAMDEHFDSAICELWYRLSAKKFASESITDPGKLPISAFR